MKGTILGLVGFLFLILVVFVAYLGVFKTITFEEKDLGQYTIVYDDHIGEYSKVTPVMDKVYEDLQREGVDSTLGFGIYYDNPKLVDKDKLRSRVGSILNDGDLDKVEILKEKGFKIDVINKSKYLVSEFPYKNKFSFIVGVMKYYPKLEEYSKTNNINVTESMEIYDIPNGKIIFAQKLSN